MLHYLKIKNFALIEDAEIEFGSKFNVITGESGSGKSIILGALGLLFGNRADKNIIRSNSERCEVTAIFLLNDITRNRCREFFINNDFSLDDLDENELEIRRIITISSSRNYVNGNLVSSKLLNLLMTTFLDFNQPEDELSLNSQSRQLELLDRFANLDLSAYQKVYKEYNEILITIENFEKNLPKLEEVEEANQLILDFEKLNVLENEDVILANRHKILANSQEIIGIGRVLSNSLTDSENSIIDGLANVIREFYNLNRLCDNGAETLLNDAELISENIRNLSLDIEKFISNIELDSEEFYNLENRLAEIHKLKRNYGPLLENVFDNYEKSQKVVELFRNSQSKKSELISIEKSLKKKLSIEADKLSLIRKEKSEELKNLMIEELKLIGFENCSLSWNFSKNELNANGFDLVDINFSANKGEDLHPLRLIASSGERSRLFLAIKSVLAKIDDVPTVIFDEIDANIGGKTAIKVANALCKVSEYRQLIIISHLAQVASKANTHLRVIKSSDQDRTFSHVKEIKEDERVVEIARLLGGDTDKNSIAVLHATELIKNKLIL